MYQKHFIFSYSNKNSIIISTQVKDRIYEILGKDTKFNLYYYKGFVVAKIFLIVYFMFIVAEDLKSSQILYRRFE